MNTADFAQATLELKALLATAKEVLKEKSTEEISAAYQEALESEDSVIAFALVVGDLVDAIERELRDRGVVVECEECAPSSEAASS